MSLKSVWCYFTYISSVTPSGKCSVLGKKEMKPVSTETCPELLPRWHLQIKQDDSSESQNIGLLTPLVTKWSPVLKFFKPELCDRIVTLVPVRHAGLNGPFYYFTSQLISLRSILWPDTELLCSSRGGMRDEHKERVCIWGFFFPEQVTSFWFHRGKSIAKKKIKRVASQENSTIRGYLRRVPGS